MFVFFVSVDRNRNFLWKKGSVICMLDLKAASWETAVTRAPSRRYKQYIYKDTASVMWCVPHHADGRSLVRHVKALWRSNSGVCLMGRGGIDLFGPLVQRRRHPAQRIDWEGEICSRNEQRMSRSLGARLEDALHKLMAKPRKRISSTMPANKRSICSE